MGFYFVKPSALTIDLFDPSDIEGDFRCDQKHINEKIKLPKYSDLKVHVLDESLFPNGYLWYRRHKQLDPFIVHYNWKKSVSEKVSVMKEHGHWLIEDS
jgi:hypothetical protein